MSILSTPLRQIVCLRLSALLCAALLAAGCDQLRVPRHTTATTARLAGTDLSRVIYVYGTADEAIGRLSEAEDSFLRSTGSTVIKVEGGHHTSMFEDPETIRRIVEALQRSL